MAKVRVYELAKELGVESKVLVSRLQDMGEFVRSASSTIEAPVVKKLKEAFPAAGGDDAAQPAKKTAKKAAAKKAAPKKATTPSEPSADELAAAAAAAAAAGITELPEELKAPPAAPVAPPMPAAPAAKIFGSRRSSGIRTIAASMCDLHWKNR